MASEIEYRHPKFMYRIRIYDDRVKVSGPDHVITPEIVFDFPNATQDEVNDFISDNYHMINDLLEDDFVDQIAEIDDMFTDEYLDEDNPIRHTRLWRYFDKKIKPLMCDTDVSVFPRIFNRFFKDLSCPCCAFHRGVFLSSVFWLGIYLAAVSILA